MKIRATAACLMFLTAGWAAEAGARDGAAPKPATAATLAAQARVRAALPLDDRSAFAAALRGRLAAPEPVTIRDPAGRIVWDLEPWQKALAGDDAPPTVNPSLWRQAQLHLIHGLFEVAPGIWQVRGYDISNITYVAGRTGWIVIDPLISVETAAAAHALVTEHLGARPVVAVIYSHSHADHYGGARAVVSDTDVRAGKVPILAPEDFVEHAVAENVIAGNAMARRATYMYGVGLPPGPTGHVGSGLGIATSAGTISLVPPSDIIRATGEERVIDGVRMVFQMTPGSEAPSEMNIWFPQLKALYVADNAMQTMHNILTLRGAVVRDARLWAEQLDETLRLWGREAEVSFAGHSWPTSGNAEVRAHIEGQRDLYRYLHDQSVRLMNEGLTGPEIAGALTLPPAIGLRWANRPYYGTLRHNVRAVYQRYMGWYDGNPVHLDPHPPVEAARRTIAYMGGGAAVLRRARRDFAAGDYRWTAEVLHKLVLAEPDNRKAALLLADSLEQLGYQAESGPWRNAYLSGARELRLGVPDREPTRTASADTLAAMPAEWLFRLLAVQVDAPAGLRAGVTLRLSDTGQTFGLSLANGVLNWRPEPFPDSTATLALPRTLLNALLLRQTTLREAIASGQAQLEGNPDALASLLGAVRPPRFWFPIVTR